MEFLPNRYRNLTVLVLAILAQLVLLAYQVKSNGEVRLIRVWAVTAVMPPARVIEAGRAGVSRFFNDYFVLLDVREENKRLKRDLDRISMDNQYLRTENETAVRAGALAIFMRNSPSKTVAAHIIGNTTDSGAKVVFVDRGSSSGVEKGMAVITPAGIVGKVVNVYGPVASVLLVTDSYFAAGVISQKNRVHGTLKGQDRALVIVDDVQNEQHVDPDEWFYTSGEDNIFPKGLPAGQVATVRAGKARKEIYLTPSGFQNGLEEVLIIIEGVHAPIPDAPPANQPVYLLAPPPDSVAAPAPAVPVPGPVSDADRVLEHYRKVGEIEKHVYGGRGSDAPDYNVDLNPKSPETGRSSSAASSFSGAPATQAPPKAPAASKPPNP